MEENFTINSNNSVAKGTVIYEKGEPIQSVALVLKGRVTVVGAGISMAVGSGNFLGMQDMWKKQHSFTYIALDDVVLYVLPVTNYEQAYRLLDEKPQYRGLLVTSLNFFFHDVFRVYNKLKQEAERIAHFVDKTYTCYVAESEKAGLLPEQISLIETMKQKEDENYTLPERMTYFIYCSRIPVETQRNYYSASAYIAKCQYEEQCAILPEVIEGCRHYAERLVKYFRVMAMDEKNLFSLIGKMALGIKRAGQKDGTLNVMLDDVLGTINDTETLLLNYAGIDMKLNRKRMEETYFALLSDDTGSLEAFDDADIHILDNSLQQILDYAPIHGRIAEEFSETVEQLTGLSDMFLRTPEVAAIRKKMVSLYYELYEAVLKKTFQDSQPPLAVKLFLRYGYVSEKLLTEEEIRTLLALPDSRKEEMACKVYTMEEWLRAIYEGRKNPSKNEFDMDYEETMRKQFQEHKLEKKEYEEALEDSDKRLHFEVENLFRYANRLLNGNISSFVPVLCSQGIFTKLENSVVTAAAINQGVRKVEEIDYRIFYRSYWTAYEEMEITKFEVEQRCTPEFILFPIYGRNAQMWQDIEGRKKNTHARILLPSFIETELTSEILRMMAHFRWEKCRTEMGAQWNNYRYPSLTSEYTDYLQFYKKNSELTPEKREKVKAQLQQCNNRHRDVFARDYADWITREATGAVKLNRVARNIMYTYCPLAPKVEKELIQQTAYQEAARRYKVESGKKEKAIMSVVRKFERAGVDIPEEVLQTKKLLIDIQGA